MKLFLIKIVVFIIPIIVILSPGIFIFKNSGEYYTSIDTIITKEEDFIIGYEFNQQNYKYLKWKTLVVQDKKEIWSVGSSRILQFRKEMFNASFYNAGLVVERISDFLHFFKSIPKEKYPNIVLINIDQFNFNQEWYGKPIGIKEGYFKGSFSFLPSFNSFKNLYPNILRGKYNNTFADSLNRVGLQALYYNSGIREDGSMSYGHQIDNLLNDNPRAFDYRFLDTYNRIKTGTNRFEYGSNLNSHSIEDLRILLKFFHDNNIQVVAFLPPFPHEITTFMFQNGKHEYINKITPSIKKYFKKYNFELWDFTDSKTINANDNEFLDGFHGSDMVYLKILRYLSNNKSQMKKYIDNEKITNYINSPINRFCAF